MEKKKINTGKKSKSKAQKNEKLLIAKYLEVPIKQKTNRWENFKDTLYDGIIKIHKKGMQKITIMFIPHSESSILNLHINFYVLTITFLFITIVGIFSIIMIIQRSSQNIQYYDMGVTNSQFYLQSSRLGEEIIPMHNTILKFAQTITTIHQKLQVESKEGKGGYALKTTFDQMEHLKELINECMKQKENCSQETIENILKISLNISLLDNEILSDINEQLKGIIEKLNSEELKTFFTYIPVDMPVEGFIKTNYGTTTILERGNNYPLRGIEFLTLPHSPVYATAQGNVTEIKYDPIFGLCVWIEHLSGIKTFYAHLNEVNVSRNEFVQKGQIIGYTGKTGKTHHNMLYYEVHIGTMAYNPHILMNDIQVLWLNLLKH